MTIDEQQNQTPLNGDEHKVHETNPFKSGENSFVVNDNTSVSVKNSNASNAPNSENDDFTSKIKELEQQLTKANDDVLRAVAEVQNLQRRSQQDIEKAHKFALERFASDLLAVVDSLERGLEITSDVDDNSKAIREGMELTLKLLLDTLGRYQIMAVTPLLQAFDPALHQAMSTREDSINPPNTVLEVFQKGYTLHERLLRPALVIVSKAPTAEA